MFRGMLLSIFWNKIKDLKATQMGHIKNCMFLVKTCVQNKQFAHQKKNPNQNHCQHSYDQIISISIKAHWHFRTSAIKIKQNQIYCPSEYEEGDRNLGGEKTRDLPQHSPAVPGAPTSMKVQRHGGEGSEESQKPQQCPRQRAGRGGSSRISSA